MYNHSRADGRDLSVFYRARNTNTHSMDSSSGPLGVQRISPEISALTGGWFLQSYSSVVPTHETIQVREFPPFPGFSIFSFLHRELLHLLPGYEASGAKRMYLHFIWFADKPWNTFSAYGCNSVQNRVEAEHVQTFVLHLMMPGCTAFRIPRTL